MEYKKSKLVGLSTRHLDSVAQAHRWKAKLKTDAKRRTFIEELCDENPALRSEDNVQVAANVKWYLSQRCPDVFLTTDPDLIADIADKVLNAKPKRRPKKKPEPEPKEYSYYSEEEEEEDKKEATVKKKPAKKTQTK